jgi:hypothetical protein
MFRVLRGSRAGRNDCGTLRDNLRCAVGLAVLLGLIGGSYLRGFCTQVPESSSGYDRLDRQIASNTAEESGARGRRHRLASLVLRWSEMT